MINQMEPGYQFPQRFSDFESEYIYNLAQASGYGYVARGPGDSTESSLYNNPKTNTVELYKLQLSIDGLQCEYYTADFTPVFYGTLAQNQNIRMQVQVFSIDLSYRIENLYVESRTNITLNNILGLKSVAFKDSENVRLEGDFSYFFPGIYSEESGIERFYDFSP